MTIPNPEGSLLDWRSFDWSPYGGPPPGDPLAFLADWWTARPDDVVPGTLGGVRGRDYARLVDGLRLSRLQDRLIELDGAPAVRGVDGRAASPERNSTAGPAELAPSWMATDAWASLPPDGYRDPGGAPWPDEALPSLDTAEDLSRESLYRNNSVKTPSTAGARTRNQAKLNLHQALNRSIVWAREHWNPIVYLVTRPDGSGERVTVSQFLEKQASAILQCTRIRAFRDGNCGRILARPIHCDVRVCPDCERRRAARLVDRFDAITIDMIRPVFWVVTLPNAALGELDAAYDVLNDALAHLRPWLKKKGAHGGVTTVESPFQKTTQTWNLHANLLLDAPWIRHDEFREVWRAVTCNARRRSLRKAQGLSGRVPKCLHESDAKHRSINGCMGASWVWVTTVKGDYGTEERRKSWREAVKYVTKGFLAEDGQTVPLGVPSQALAEILVATRNRRMVQGWGSMFGVHDQATPELEPDTLTLEEAGFPSLVGLPRTCPFCGMEQRWEPLPGDYPRVECRRDERSGALTWEPSRPAWLAQAPPATDGSWVH